MTATKQVTIWCGPVALAVKLADVLDHLAPERAASLPEHLKPRYEAALERLLGAAGLKREEI